MPYKVVIIGAGEIGGAIANILKNRAALELWDKNPNKVRFQKPLEQIVPAADFLFFCVPSSAMRDAISQILPHIKKENTTIISLAKGVEEKTCKNMAELLLKLVPKKYSWALIGGPMIAEELTRGMKGIGVVASLNKEVFNRLNELFSHTNLRLEYSSDVYGVALSGVLKNIYAVALGIAEGLGLGDDTKGWLVEESVKEMAEVADILGGKKGTVMGAAGLGDFIATGFSRYSRNRQSGEELAKIGSCGVKGEGIISLQSIMALLKGKNKKLLLLNALADIIIDKKDARSVFEALITK